LYKIEERKGKENATYIGDAELLKIDLLKIPPSGYYTDEDCLW
jgi:hypothetical protein